MLSPVAIGETDALLSVSISSRRSIERVSTNEPSSRVSLGGNPTHQPLRVAPRSGLPTEAEQSSDIIMLIERLAGLRAKDILSEEEFSAKKVELLARL